MTAYMSTMPDIFGSSSIGKMTIQNGVVQCFVDPISGTGIRMFRVVGGDLTLKNMSANTCTADVAGIVIQNDTGNTTLTNVTVGGVGTGIHATDGGSGGCIDHGSGNINITNSNFTNCVVDNGGSTGNGGALYIRGVSFSTNAAITNTTFQANIAGTSGGAIYLSGTDAISIVNSTFTLNIANGNTFSAGNSELGGGAIYATNTATGGHMLPDVPSHFLIMNTVFTTNTAPTGTGGAILLGSGNLSSGVTLLPPPPWIIPVPGPIATTNIPGGVFDSQFFGNSAGGTWNGVPIDTRAGSGGAIFSHGTLEMLDSSLIGNASNAGSGGGIAQYGPSSTVALSNVTLNGNSATVRGGALANLRNTADNFNGTMSLRNVTISGNSASAGGGGALYNGGAQLDVVARNTIFDGSGGNCAGPNGITDQAGNLQNGSGTDCGASMPVGDPKLAAAAPFGGANFTVFVMTLNDGSAASGAGDPATCSAAPIYDLDAALNSRPSGKPNCDVGAFESGTTTPVMLQTFDVE
jgi:predicted outer membrane repeat protein